MGRILISFDPLFSPGEHFDFLGRKAAEVLSYLFPGVQVILRYRKGHAVSSIRPSLMSEQGSAPGQLRTRFMSVLDDKLWS